MKIGDTVTLEGDSGFCTRIHTKVARIITKYDENTGAPYDVIQVSDGQLFDSRTGLAITPPTAYYIAELV